MKCGDKNRNSKNNIVNLNYLKGYKKIKLFFLRIFIK